MATRKRAKKAPAKRKPAANKKAPAKRKPAAKKKPAVRNASGGIKSAVIERLVQRALEKNGAVPNKRKRPRRRNPQSGDVAESIGAPPKKIRDLVGEFLGHGLERVEFVEAPAWCPNDMVSGGEVVAIEYHAFKPHLDPEPQVYRHEFLPGNALMCFTSDRVIVILGDYKIGVQGLED